MTKIKVFVLKQGQKIKEIHEKDIGTVAWDAFYRELEEYKPQKYFITEWMQATWVIGNSTMTGKKAKQLIDDYYSNLVQSLDERSHY